MTVNELRIGNLVDWKMEDGSWQPFQIVSLHMADKCEHWRPTLIFWSVILLALYGLIKLIMEII